MSESIFNDSSTILKTQVPANMNSLLSNCENIKCLKCGMEIAYILIFYFSLFSFFM